MAIEFDDVKEVLERIIISYGVKSRTELADLLSIPLPTINNWVARGSVPGNYIIQCSIETQSNLEWLVTGKLVNASPKNKSTLSLTGKELYKHILSSGGKSVLQRILTAYGFSMQKQLGDLLGLSSGTISTWIRRDYFPGDVVVACALDTGVSLKWLATGMEDEFSKSTANVSQSNTRDIPSYYLESGKLTQEMDWSIDNRFIPESIKFPCYIKGNQSAWIIDKGNIELANGRWLLIIDGYHDIYDITRIPNNQIQVGLLGGDSKFTCSSNDVGCIGQVIFTIENNK